jgi:replication factor C subunit 1
MIFLAFTFTNCFAGKLSRFVKEIQAHMRLRTSADRHEIRQQYLPVLWNRLIKRLEIEGSDCIEEVMDLMDSYFITKEDWDAILELGVGPQDEKTVTLDKTTKANFTRKYNMASHPLPFMKATTAPPPANRSKEKPDLEEAIEESDDEALIDPAAEGEEEEELDLKKDKYVSAPKKRKAPAKKKSAGAGDDDGEGDDNDAEPPSKKAKGKAKAAPKTTAKGKGKKA